MDLPLRFKLMEGEKVVAYGVQWSDNSASVNWVTDDAHTSFVLWPSMTSALEHVFTPNNSGQHPVIEWIDIPERR